jgi:site-specific DNA-methyltransferase (adenine-specific)
MSTLDMFAAPPEETEEPFTPEIMRQGDAFEFLASLPSESVDLVVTDPPYQSLELHRAKGTTTRLKQSKGSSNKWFGVIPNARLIELFDQVFRVLKRDRHFWLFCDEATENVIKFQQMIIEPDGLPRRNSDGSFPTKSGLKIWKSAIWLKTTLDGEKPRGGMGYHLRGACERLIFLEKGKRKLNDLGMPDVFCGPSLRSGYPTAKDIDVVKALVSQSTLEGELVVDPFMGGWTTAEAALSQKRRTAGNDIDIDSIRHGRTRLARWLPTDLPPLPPPPVDAPTAAEHPPLPPGAVVVVHGTADEQRAELDQIKSEAATWATKIGEQT